jgi:hypothetical protein
MRISSTVAWLSSDRAGHALEGLPEADGYEVVVKPLRYRKRAHLSAWTDFASHRITLQVPEPFVPFGEVVPYAAKRRPGKGLHFIWLTEGITFRCPEEVLRFLYLHEWMHWYLRERLGRRAAAETACDRFALRNYRSSSVGILEAKASLRRRAAARPEG